MAKHITSIPLLLLLCVLSIIIHMHGAHAYADDGNVKEIDSGMAQMLCNGTVYCSFMNPLIWVNHSLPEEDDDVKIVLQQLPVSITIGLYTSITLNSLTIDSDYFTLVIQNVPIFSSKVVRVVGTEYAPSIQAENATMNIRSLSTDYANFLLTNSELIVDTMICANSSLLSLLDSNIYCTTCDLDDVQTDAVSTFTGNNVNLLSSSSTFMGYSNITNLVVGSHVVFFGATLWNVTFLPSAYMFAHVHIDINYLTFGILSTLLLFNTTGNIATHSDSFILGRGDLSLEFELTDTFSFGNPDVVLDLSPYHVKFVDSNVGTFTNVAFGNVLSVTNPGSVVDLTLNSVTFTLTSLITANITATGLTTSNGLTVIGDVSCKGGTTSIFGQLYSSTFSQSGGYLELAGYLTSSDFVSIADSSATVLNTARIQGDLILTNSTLSLTQPLMVQGDFASDSTSTIRLPPLTTNSQVFLNISGDVDNNGTLFIFSVLNAPSERTVYPLFAYGGSLTGTFTPNFTVPDASDADRFSIEQKPHLVSIVFTPSEPSFFTPGPKLYGTIGAIVLIALAFIMSIYCIRRTTAKRRQYEIIPS